MRKDCNERKSEENAVVASLRGAPPMNTGFLVSVELGFTGPTTWLISESTSSWTTLASRITEERKVPKLFEQPYFIDQGTETHYGSL